MENQDETSVEELVVAGSALPNTIDIDDDMDPLVEPDDRKTINSIGGILKALSAAVRSGNLTRAQARSFRADLGIMKSSFTKKQITPAKRKAKRIAQRAARKVNRQNKRG